MIELKTKVIRGSGEGPHLLVTASVHGDEFEGIVAVQRLIRDLEASELRGTVTLVPVVNESAYELRGRCGEDGLDLARTCPGNPDGSNTEQVAAALSELIESADLYIDLHSGGVLMDVYPLTGYMLVKSEPVLEAQRRMARAFGLPLVWGTSAELDGRSMSVARDAQVPAIYTEYRGSGLCNPRGATAIVAGCRNVMAEFGMLDQQESESSEPLVHEDTRAGAGHMQVCYPAPRPGVFEARVQLGERVEKGDTLGVLSDPFTGQSEEIHAIESGTPIVLRVYPQVVQGDALAVILEEDRKLQPLVLQG